MAEGDAMSEPTREELIRLREENERLKAEAERLAGMWDALKEWLTSEAARR